MSRVQGRKNSTLLTIGIVVAGSAALLLGLYIWIRLYQPLSANFDPLIGSVQKAGFSSWAAKAELKPCCFDAGESRSDVLGRLEASEFVQEDRSNGFNQKFFLDEAAHPALRIFSRSASRLPCRDTFYIAIEFDERNTVKRAAGTWINAACM